MHGTDPLLTPPKYCRYASGACDQSFDAIPHSRAFFIYPSQPPHLAKTISDCVALLRMQSAGETWLSWEDLAVGGQIVFCELCKAIRATSCVVANITSMNFNVLFELGFAIGLRKPVIPIRDVTYESWRKQFDEIGTFDTLGFDQFTNSLDLAKLVTSRPIGPPPIQAYPDLNKMQPILFIRSPIDTDGSVKLFSALKKS